MVDEYFSSCSSVTEQIAKQSDVVKSLKASKAEKSQIDEEVAKLLALKALVDTDIEKSGCKRILKQPKGTRDVEPHQMVIRDKVIGKITDVFKRHGAESIDTPVFELKEVLMGKYGEESKLIYELADQGGELLALRYDLTVPFARYCAMKKIKAIKRYHIGKVYRRDQPAISRGRFREFYQCDFDIAGQFEGLLPDTECIKIVCEILESLNVGNFCVKINHRKLLDGLLSVCGVPADKFNSICSAIDKLDKMDWNCIKKEMVSEKGLAEEMASKIGEFVQLKGNTGLVQKLLSDDSLQSSNNAVSGLKDIQTVLEFCEVLQISDKVTFDMSLARGLDYYTGIIYEATLLDSVAPPSGIAEPSPPGESDEICGLGSVAGGGRYDNLVGIFDAKGHKVPCVGVSIGIERLLSIIERKEVLAAKAKGFQSMRTTETQVIVASAQKKFHMHRLKLCNELWAAGIKTEFSYKLNPKMLDQLQYAEENRIPWAVIIGESEIAENCVTLRNISTRFEERVPRSQLIKTLNQNLACLSE